MDSAIFQIEPQFWPHLRDAAKTLYALQIWGGGGREHVGGLSAELLRLLEATQSNELEWIFSFLGPLRPSENFTVLRHLVDLGGRFAFAMPAYVKEDFQPIPLFIEISMRCSLELFADILGDPELNLRELFVGGWLVARPTAGDSLGRFKFEHGRFYFDGGVVLAFCSRPNFVAVDFLAPDVNNLHEIQRIVG